MSVRLNLIIDDDAPAMLTTLAKSERKRGEWVSGVVRAAYEARGKGSESTDIPSRTTSNPAKAYTACGVAILLLAI